MFFKEFLKCVRLCDQIEVHCGSEHCIESVSVYLEHPAYKEFLDIPVALIRSYHAIGLSDYYYIVLEV